MIKETIQLFGFLVLSFLGIISPFLLIILTISKEGTKELTIQYENEKKQNEGILKNISDIDELQKTINKIKSNKAKVEKKISSLDIKRQSLNLFIPLIISFSFVILVLIFYYIIWLMIVLIIASISMFIYSLVILWQTLCNISDIRKLIDDNQKDYRNKTLELLKDIKDTNKTEDTFLKNITFLLNGKKLDSSKIDTFKLFLNEKNRIKIIFTNNENKIIKNMQMGITLPLEFIIDNKNDFINNFNIFEDFQLIKFDYQLYQSQSRWDWPDILITPILKTDLKSYVYIKAENILPTYFNIIFNIVESDFKLLTATYGNDNYSINVYNKVYSEIVNGTLKLTASNQFFGTDPHKGFIKKLTISYTYLGIKHQVEIQEDKTLVLP